MLQGARARQGAQRRGALAPPSPGEQRVLTWWGDVWQRFRRQRLPLAAGVLLSGLILVALLAPVLAPYDPLEQFRQDGLSELGEPLPPTAKFLLGTDGLGRDLLSRL